MILFPPSEVKRGFRLFSYGIYLSDFLKEICTWLPRGSPVCAHTARRRAARDVLEYAPMRQSNLQNRHGARNSDFLLSGVGAISRNTPHLREQKNPCVTVDWRKKRSNGTLVCFFFVLFLSNKEKGHRSPLSKEFLNPFAEKRSKINKNLCV